jgi:hypothetical protein
LLVRLDRLLAGAITLPPSPRPGKGKMALEKSKARQASVLAPPDP